MRAACSSNLRRLASSASTLRISASCSSRISCISGAAAARTSPSSDGRHVVDAAGLAGLGLGESLIERGALLLERRLVAGVHLLDRGAERLQLLGELGAERVAGLLVLFPQAIDFGHDRGRVTFELSLNGSHQARPKLVDLRTHLLQRSSRWTATGVSWRRTPIGSVPLSAVAPGSLRKRRRLRLRLNRY